MLIFDGDYPMAPVAMRLRRDVTLPIAELRRRDRDPDDVAMASLHEMRRGGVAAAILKVASDMEREGNSIKGANPAHRTYAIGKGQIGYYHALERAGEIRVLRSAEAVRDHVSGWEAASGGSRMTLPVGAVLGLEGADSVVDPEQLGEWWDDGIRVVSLGHYGVSPYAHGTGTGTAGGLLEPGPAFLREMDRRGMLLDVTHTSDASVREAIDHFGGPLLATHSNVRALTPGERQLPDDLIRAVIERNGVIGVSMDAWMIHPTANPDWGTDAWPNPRRVFARHEVTLDLLARHIDYVCQLAGNVLHAGIGGDTDGQGGRENAPIDIDTVADYAKLADILSGRGYSDADVENVMYRNWVRFFERALPPS